jgi:hypothetical protein
MVSLMRPKSDEGKKSFVKSFNCFIVKMRIKHVSHIAIETKVFSHIANTIRKWFRKSVIWTEILTVFFSP